MKKFFVGILKALAYFGLYYGMQLLVNLVIVLYDGASVITGFVMGGQNMQDPEVMELFFAEMIRIILDSAMPTVVISGILTVVTVFLVFLFRKRKPVQELSLRTFSGKAVFPVVLMGLSFNVLTGVFLSLLPIPEDLYAAYDSASSSVMGDNFAMMFVGTVLVAPVVEEVIFRGLAYTRMKQGMPAAVAMVLSALLFGAAHGQLLWMLYTAVFGMVLAWVLERTGSLFPCILLHAGYNLCSVLLGFLPEEAPDMAGVLLVFGAVIVAVISTLWFCKIPKTEAPFVQEEIREQNEEENLVE